jgi:hypothetical protein
VVGALFYAVEQVGGDLGDLCFGGFVVTAFGQQGTGVLPGHVAERDRRCSQIRPGDSDPSAVVVVADPDAGNVVGVVTDLPLAVFVTDSGMLTAVRVKRLGVIGAAGDLDAVRIDRAPGRREQFNVIVGRHGTAT